MSAPVGLKRKLRQRVQAFLADGEHARAIFVAFTGVNAVLPGAQIIARYVVVVVTDRGVLVLLTRAWALGRPTELVARLRFDQVDIGPWRGVMFATIELDGVPYRVNWRFRSDLNAAHAALAGER